MSDLKLGWECDKCHKEYDHLPQKCDCGNNLFLKYSVKEELHNRTNS